RAAIVFLFLQLILRVIGRKELGRYSTYDVAVLFLIATAARKSITGDDASITNAAVALTTIFGLEWLLSYLCFRSGRAARVLEGPVLPLVRDGEVDDRNMCRSRISREDLEAHGRQNGVESLDAVKDAYLERSGRISII